MTENGESKNKFWKGVLTGVLATVLAGAGIAGLAAGIFFIGRTVISGDRQPAAGAGDSERYGRIEEKLELIQGIVDQYFLYEEDMDKVEDGIYTGLMYGLDDPYAAYYNEEDYASFMEDSAGEYYGIGAMVQQNVSTGIITVVKVFKDAPAFEAGLLPGDILYKVEGEAVTGTDLDLLVQDQIRGEEGTVVHVTVLRGEASEEVELAIERRHVEVPTVEHRMLRDHIGYIYVMQFDSITGSQFVSAVEDLENQGMEKLVIDVRDNPGGILDTAVEMMAYLLPEDKMGGMLIYTEDKDGKGDRYLSRDGEIVMENDYGYPSTGYPREDGHQLDIPMAVLINGNSASASELFSGALQDYGAAVIVGTQSFGKGIVQNLIPLGDGTAVKLTTSRYYIPSGVCIHETGITPDIVVELDEELRNQVTVDPEKDNQLAAAIEALQ